LDILKWLNEDILNSIKSEINKGINIGSTSCIIETNLKGNKTKMPILRLYQYVVTCNSIV
jgi:hypothetical protein